MSVKIVTIIGARPQIIKAAALSRAIRNTFSDSIQEIIVHTGQHYDENMSQVFFDEMSIPRPDYNLDVRSGSHGKQTAAMLAGIEEILLKEQPQCLVVYGDTNSTLAGSVAASKINVPVVHIESGLRSFNKRMPEEVNRIVCDHLSTLLFTPTASGVKNLTKEGFETDAKPPYTADNPKVFHCGDIMYDNSLYFAEVAEKKTDIIKKLHLEANGFILSTIHRDYNTDSSERLTAIFKALDEVSKQHAVTIVLPLHPRTAKLLEQNLTPDVYRSVIANAKIKIIPPVSFLEMTALEKNARLIMTDSGGVQKESFFFKKPCIILRSETEWVELVENGNALVTDADEKKIQDAATYYLKNNKIEYPPLYGDGRAAEFICARIVETFGKK